jgi:hypothetical protein
LKAKNKAKKFDKFSNSFVLLKTKEFENFAFFAFSFLFAFPKKPMVCLLLLHHKRSGDSQTNKGCQRWGFGARKSSLTKCRCKKGKEKDSPFSP